MLVIYHGAPASRRNIRFIFGSNTVGYRHVTNDTKHASKSFFDIGFLRNGIHIKRGAHKAVSGTVSAWQHGGASNLLPVLVKCKLLIKGGGVSHHLVCFAVVNHLLAINVFYDGAITCGVRER